MVNLSVIHEALASVLLSGWGWQNKTNKPLPLFPVSLWTSLIAVTQWGYVGDSSVHNYSQGLANHRSYLHGKHPTNRTANH